MIGFAGLSHLGIVSSITTASKGFEVVAYDPDVAVCETLSGGALPILEPGLSELLIANRFRIQFTHQVADLSACRLIYFSTDVPTDEHDHSDLSCLYRLLDEVVTQAPPEATLVILSQVPPGFTRKFVDRLAQRYDDCAFRVFYQVETLIFGRAVERALHPERIIVGCRDSNTVLPLLYADLLQAFNAPILTMRYESAELAKISINAYLASSVSTTNTLAELCEAIGADWSEIIPALKLDRRIGPYAYLSPGLGISGGHLERDLVIMTDLAAEYGTDTSVIDAWLANSRHRRDWVLKTVHSEVISRYDNPTIALWGLAYKPDTVSTKNSPAVALINALRPFSVCAYDPQAVLDTSGLPYLTLGATALDTCRGADVLIVTTPWNEFTTVDLGRVREAMRGCVIIDPFAVLDRGRCTELGFVYYRLGAPHEVMEWVE